MPKRHEFAEFLLPGEAAQADLLPVSLLGILPELPQVLNGLLPISLLAICPELRKVLNSELCLSSPRDSNYGLGYFSSFQTFGQCGLGR